MEIHKSEQEKRMQQFPLSLSSNKVTTQVSFGGFMEDVSAKYLTDFLEREIGIVARCRLKTSSTPPDSYLNFDIVHTSRIKRKDKYERVEPHAFVHFMVESTAAMALELACSGKLMLDGCPLKASVGTSSSYRKARGRKTFPFTFPHVTVEIGFMLGQNEFLVSWVGPERKVDFEIDPFEGTCRILFTRETVFSLKKQNRHAVIDCNFKLEFLIRDIIAVRLYKETSPLALVLQLGASPSIHYRTADDDIYVQAEFPSLDDEDPWIRTTDFTSSGAIGRGDTYRISFPPRLGPTLEKVMDYFRECRITEEQTYRSLNIQNEPDFGKRGRDFFFSMHNKEEISFQLMFLLNALVHKGIVNQHQLSEEFFNLLRSQTESINIAAIHHIYSCKHRLFNACETLKTVQEWLLQNPKLLHNPRISHDNVEVRRLVITPTRAYCTPPEVELSNRVLRKYRDVADRFLRVTFMDEGFQQLNNSSLCFHAHPIVKNITSSQQTTNRFKREQRTNIFRRVKNILLNGFSLCGRKYTFLAFSSNQLRDRSAWFFAEEKDTTVDSIRTWMGSFDDKNVAKYAARMGQCFSSSYATVDVPAEAAKIIPDIERNEYVFSDGIGKITPELSMDVAEKLQMTLNPPSAFQIRYAGCKGVVACWPKNGGDEKTKLFLRPSMSKFRSEHTMLEVVSWSRFQPGFLNRQIIILLSSLGVQDNIFSELQDSMVFKLNQMLENTDVAFEVLTASCTGQTNTAAMMLSAGFKPQTEPHLRRMLSCIRLAQLEDLRVKSRIFVPQGRWLMGVLDELGELEHGQCFIQVSSPSLESCSHKHASRFSEKKKNVKVITGTVAIAKNPCLHPGDIRILEAVDVPDLHHLVDCLVFPQKGDRPHTDEASGSDLDGDLYFATWDENLLPPSQVNETPMDYSPAKPKLLQRSIESKDIIDFFTKNMVNDNLGIICNAHVVHADLSKTGAQDEKCKKLAEMAAMAVDFPKTGKYVPMDPNLKPKVYPDFMGKEESMSYESDKILGRLYRDIKNFSQEQKPETEEIKYDLDIEIPDSEGFISEAWDSKTIYDRQLNTLLAQYKVSTEAEVVTGHFWSMPKFQSTKLGDVKKRLQNAYMALKKEFRHEFENLGPGSQELTDEERNTLYEQKASAWYKVTYHPQWIKKAKELRETDEDGGSTWLSFAWIAMDYLARLKIRRRGPDGIDVFLADYQANRI